MSNTIQLVVSSVLSYFLAELGCSGVDLSAFGL